MGMFDYVRCEHELPDGFAGDLEYQTKDTPAQSLDDYTITTEGKLISTGDMELDFHGSLEFYSSNVCGVAPFGTMTKDDEPPWYRCYVALFDHGNLLKIEGGLEPAEVSEDNPHLTRDEWHRASREMDRSRATPK